METASKIWAVVPAAGSGQRMGESIPKQYLTLHNQPILQITLNKLLALPELAGVVVALARDDNWFEQQIAPDARVTRVTGGNQRAESVFNALAWLSRQGCGQDWVLVHDAARPCVRPGNIKRLMAEVLARGTGGLLAVPLADTLKQVDGTEVTATLDRSALWLAHTPQMFRVAELHDALRSALAAKATVTDEASAMERVGIRPLVVADSRDNIKVTQPEDLAFAHWCLSQQAHPDQ